VSKESINIVTFERNHLSYNFYASSCFLTLLTPSTLSLELSLQAEGKFDYKVEGGGGERNSNPSSLLKTKLIIFSRQAVWTNVFKRLVASSLLFTEYVGGKANKVLAYYKNQRN
jgi:hypothetical protein